MTLVYRHYDQETLDRECNPSSTIPDADGWLVRYAELSAATRARRGAPETFRYGPHSRHALDVFSAGQGAPIHVFIHGGGWRMLSKDESSFVADGFVPHGVTTVVISYRLLPETPLADIVADACLALRWVFENAARFGGDAARIQISGHSAGAHLAASVLCEMGRSLPVGMIASAILLSGNYELEPLRLSARNRIIGLDAESAARNSPARKPPGAGARVLVGWGEKESLQYQTQGLELAANWTSRGARCETLALPGLHHLEAPLELGNPGSETVRRAIALRGVEKA
jgi:arylformamidase